MRRRARILAAAAPLFLAGCPSLPLMQSAETIPEGDVQHAIGVEYFDTNTERGPGTDDFPLFLIPTYTVRFGVADHVDVGIRTSVFLNLAFDVKLQAIDTEAFDLAFAPSLQYAWFWGWLQLPMIVGFNLGESVQLVVSGRVAYFAQLDADGGGVIDEEFADTDFYVGAGAGIYIEGSPRFGVMPEIQYMRGTREGDPAMWSFNVAFAIGAQPGARSPPGPPIPVPPGPAAPAAPASPSPPPPAGYAPPAPGPDGAPGTVPQIPPGYGPPTPTPTPTPTPPPAPTP